MFGEKGKALNCKCRNAIDFDLFLVYYLQYGASSNKTRITALHKQNVLTFRKLTIKRIKIESRVTYAAPFSLGCLLHSHHLLVKSTFVAHPDAHRPLPSTLVFEGSCCGNSRQLHIEWEPGKPLSVLFVPPDEGPYFHLSHFCWWIPWSWDQVLA